MASAAASPDFSSRCLVYARLRPTNEGEIDPELGTFPLLTMVNKQVRVRDGKDYQYDGTFGSNSSQETVFENVARPCVNHALEGFRSAIMAYGQTGTGKSYTMCCTKPGSEGIIPRAAKYLFQCIREDKTRVYSVLGQFIQIYRDNLGDLMTENGREKVDIRWDKAAGVTFPGCSTYELHDEEEFMALYDEGNKKRVVTATAMNAESSRGHTALVIWIASKKSEDGGGELDGCGEENKGKITFIDLAGYERFSKTGISMGNAIMKDEARTINASLLALGHVVSALSAGDKHVPWRNAKLTRLLQDSIGGCSRTTIVLTLGPSSDHVHESTNTLQFGQRAMAVKVEAKITTTVNYEKLAGKLQAMLDEKSNRINLLELQAVARDTERQEAADRHRRDIDLLRLQHKSQLEALLNSDNVTKAEVAALMRQNELEVEDLIEQQNEEIMFATDAYEQETKDLVGRMSHEKDVKAMTEKMELMDEIERLRSQVSGMRSGEGAEGVVTQETGAEEQNKSPPRSGENETTATATNTSFINISMDSVPNRSILGGEATRLQRDLTKAEEQITAKNATILQRVADIQRLESAVEQLTIQLLHEGFEPDVHGEDFSTGAVIDVSLAEEMREGIEKELAVVKRRNAELMLEVDRQAEICDSRAADMAVLHDHIKALEGQLREGGTTPVQQTERTEKVEVVSVETHREELLALEAELNKRDDHILELKKELEDVVAAGHHATGSPGSHPGSLANSFADSALGVSIGDGSTHNSLGGAKPVVPPLRHPLSARRVSLDSCSNVSPTNEVARPPSGLPPLRLNPGLTPRVMSSAGAQQNNSFGSAVAAAANTGWQTARGVRVGDSALSEQSMTVHKLRSERDALRSELTATKDRLNATEDALNESENRIEELQHELELGGPKGAPTGPTPPPSPVKPEAPEAPEDGQISAEVGQQLADAEKRAESAEAELRKAHDETDRLRRSVNQLTEELAEYRSKVREADTKLGRAQERLISQEEMIVCKTRATATLEKNLLTLREKLAVTKGKLAKQRQALTKLTGAAPAEDEEDEDGDGADTGHLHVDISAWEEVVGLLTDEVASLREELFTTQLRLAEGLDVAGHRRAIRRASFAPVEANDGKGETEADPNVSELRKLLESAVQSANERCSAKESELVHQARMLQEMADLVIVVKYAFADPLDLTRYRKVSQAVQEYVRNRDDETFEGREAQRRLEEELRKKEEEAAKVKRVLKSLSDERKKDVTRLRSIEEEKLRLQQEKEREVANARQQLDEQRDELMKNQGNIKDMLEARRKEVESLQLLSHLNEEQNEHQRRETERLREEVKRYTQALMDVQAEKAKGATGGIWDKLRSTFQ